MNIKEELFDAVLFVVGFFALGIAMMLFIQYFAWIIAIAAFLGLFYTVAGIILAIFGY